MPQARPDVAPDLHFLYIARNIPVDWFFDAARGYWERFRPTVISSFDLIGFVPSERTVIVTALVMRDSAPAVGVDLARFRPDAYFDALVPETIEAARSLLDQRAALNQPFGVALIGATMTPLDAAIPTPNLPVQPRGFVTATPTVAAPSTPQATPAPIQPTPGAVIGGGG